VSPNFSLSAAAWNNLRVGFYSNASLASNGHISYEVTDLQYDDQFDPNWHGGAGGGGGGGSTPPATPGGVRVISAGVIGLGPVCGLIAAFVRRGRARRQA